MHNIAAPLSLPNFQRVMRRGIPALQKSFILGHISWVAAWNRLCTRTSSAWPDYVQEVRTRYSYCKVAGYSIRTPVVLSSPMNTIQTRLMRSIRL